MKSKKLAGVRLYNYLNDGINWKDHKDVVLDFWITYIAKGVNYNPNALQGFVTTDSLPTEVRKKYEEWFNSYDFQNVKDKNWVNFVNGTLNIFYHTSGYTEDKPGLWYIDLMKSEDRAREIVETQTFHGNPNLNSFMKIETNSKPEEVGGRRNGYVYARKLASVKPADTRGYYWGVIFQCDEVVSIKYDCGGHLEERSICWAANPTHITLVKITADGRFVVVPSEVRQKLWMDRRVIPEGNITKEAMASVRLLQYLQKNFGVMYGVFDNIKKKVDTARINATARKNALITMSDEEVPIGNDLPYGGDVERFISYGNVSPEKLEYNKKKRQSIHQSNIERRKEIRAKQREIEKGERKKLKAKEMNYNALA